MRCVVNCDSNQLKSTIYFNGQDKFVETEETEKFFTKVFEDASWIRCVYYSLKRLFTQKKYLIVQTTTQGNDQNVTSTSRSVYLVNNVVDGLIQHKLKSKRNHNNRPYYINKSGDQVEDIIRFVNTTMPFLMFGEFRSNDGEVFVPSALNAELGNKTYTVKRLNSTKATESESGPIGTLKNTKSIFDQIFNMKQVAESTRLAKKRRSAISMIRNEVFQMELDINSYDIFQVGTRLKKIRDSLHLFTNIDIKKGTLEGCFDFLLNKGGLNDEELCKRLLRIVFLHSILSCVLNDLRIWHPFPMPVYGIGIHKELKQYCADFLNKRNVPVLKDHDAHAQSILNEIPRGYLENVFKQAGLLDRFNNKIRSLNKAFMFNYADKPPLVAVHDDAKDLMLYLFNSTPLGGMQRKIYHLIFSGKRSSQCIEQNEVNESVNAIFEQIGKDDYTLENYKTELDHNIQWFERMDSTNNTRDIVLPFLFVSTFKYCLETGDDLELIDKLLDLSFADDVLRDVLFEMLRSLLKEYEHKETDENYGIVCDHLDKVLTQKLNEEKLSLGELERWILGTEHSSKTGWYVLISKSMPRLAELTGPLLQQFNQLSNIYTDNYSENTRFVNQFFERIKERNETYSTTAFRKQLDVCIKLLNDGQYSERQIRNRLHFLLSLSLKYYSTGTITREVIGCIDQVLQSKKSREVSTWYSVLTNISDEFLQNQSLSLHIRFKSMFDQLAAQPGGEGFVRYLRKRILSPYEKNGQKKVDLILNSKVTSWKLFENLKLADPLPFTNASEVVAFLNERLTVWKERIQKSNVTNTIQEKLVVMENNTPYLAAPRDTDKRREFYDNIMNALATLVKYYDTQYANAADENEKKKCIDEAKISLGEINDQFGRCCSQWSTVIKSEHRRVQSDVVLSPEDEFHKQAMNVRVKIVEELGVEHYGGIKDIHIYNALFNEDVSKKFMVPYLPEYHFPMQRIIADKFVQSGLQAYTPMRVFSNFAYRFITNSAQDTELDDMFNEVQRDITLKEYASVLEYVDDKPSTSSLFQLPSLQTIFDNANSIFRGFPKKKKIKNELKIQLKRHLGRSDAQLVYFRRNIEAIVTNMRFNGDDADQQKERLTTDVNQLTQYIGLGREELKAHLEGNDQSLAHKVAIQACLSDMRALMSLKGELLQNRDIIKISNQFNANKQDFLSFPKTVLEVLQNVENIHQLSRQEITAVAKTMNIRLVKNKLDGIDYVDSLKKSSNDLDGNAISEKDLLVMERAAKKSIEQNPNHIGLLMLYLAVNEKINKRREQFYNIHTRMKDSPTYDEDRLLILMLKFNIIARE
ncbi:hypothetical protein N9N03_02100 [Chlamydiia bacterium]|nr:hypothetical protein [Chlamydiia bacterium]